MAAVVVEEDVFAAIAPLGQVVWYSRYDYPCHASNGIILYRPVIVSMK
jgi:hypothetical protein